MPIPLIHNADEREAVTRAAFSVYCDLSELAQVKNCFHYLQQPVKLFEH